MKFFVGYQSSPLFREALRGLREHYGELYFSWPGMASGRSGAACSLPGAESFKSALAEYAGDGMSMHLLLNGNCYGRRSLSRRLMQQIGDLVEELMQLINLKGVTTTSPVIARFLKMNFASLEVRASVNMEIGTVEALDYLGELFDSFYLKREYNYDIDRIRQMHEHCRNHGKKLYLLANSGCLSFCPARTFHDNLVAHQDEIAEMDNAFSFPGLCHDFLRERGSRGSLLARSNFIRPEDVHHYEGLCDGMKLATRVSTFAPMILRAYAAGRHPGNILDLTEPCHSASFQPEILANDKFPGDFWERRILPGAGEYCSGVQEQITVNTNTNLVFPNADK